jgi:hypothetical protein
MNDVTAFSSPPTPDHQTWLDILVRLGPIAVIALWLVWNQTSQTTNNGAQLTKLEVTLEAHVAEMQRTSADEKATDTVRISLLRAICHGVAKSPSEHSNCEVGK